MNSQNFFFNKTKFLTNNKNQNEEKLKSGYESKYKNYYNNNSNNSKAQIIQNKKNAFEEEPNRKIQIKIEDFYNNEIYKQSISQYNFGFFDQDNIYKYKTISVTDIFQKKNKQIFNFDKNRSYNNRNYITPIELEYKLNLSFEIKNNKDIFFEKPFNNDKSHLSNIIRIFDKSHKQIQKINQKSFTNKYNHYYAYKNRINNYNYLKFKTKSKFSKKDTKKSLKKNYSKIIESHINLSSGIAKEISNKKNKPAENKEFVNKISETEGKNSLNVKNTFEFSTINGNRSSTNKSLFNNIITEQNNKINDIKITHKENNNFTINTNIPIGLNKMSIVDKTNDDPNSNDINNNRNSVNFSGRFFYKYRAINNINRKSISIFEETEKNNNNKSIQESNQLKENIKKGKIIKIENIENNRILYKKIQRNEINKNSNKIYEAPKQIKRENEQKDNKEKILDKAITLTTPTNEQISINNENNVHIPLINYNKICF